MEEIHKFLKNNKDNFYLAFRLLVGIMFLFHGLQKFGLIGDKPAVALVSIYGLAAIIETLAGLAITLGFHVELAAILGSIDMIGAVLKAHLPTSLVFTNNGGELALMYLAAFFVLATHGAGKKWVLKG